MVKTQTPFQRHERADERMRSAANLVKVILQSPDLSKEHRLEFVKLALWKVTEAEWGKHDLRFRSKAASSMLRDHRSYKWRDKHLRHDHVFQRKHMVDELLNASPEAVATILNKAIGCIVTKAEHDNLRQFKNFDGWERYRQAGIVIIDMETGRPFDFPSC